MKSQLSLIVAAILLVAPLVCFAQHTSLLTSFTNPTPAASDFFGSAVVAVGNDRVLIGAYQDDAGAPNAGAAYLFSTNGTLLTTFTNPTPASNEWFGYSMAAVGTNRVLIAAFTNGGTAYLFSTEGTLLTTFTKPIRNNYFSSVAAVGNERVLIGARGEAAYLFSINGALLTTFTNLNRETPSVHLSPRSGMIGSPLAQLATARERSIRGRCISLARTARR